MILRIAIMATISLALGVSPQTTQSVPKKPAEWFARAEEVMDLRTFGAAPFHLKVSFHAFPGEELLAPGEKPTIITGDGDYEETWLEPHRWSREVNFGDYHAIEQESGRSRKMKASSDYVPLRVIMLIEALLFPIPRELTSESSPYAKGWAVDRVKTGDITLVRLSKTSGDQHAEFSEAFYLLPSGMLALRNKIGLVTITEGATLFAGKLVPKHLSIKVGERELLTADIGIENTDAAYAPAGLPGEPAPAGFTLRPLHASGVRLPGFPNSSSGASSSYSPPAFSYQVMLDRQGRYREAEILLAPNLSVGAGKLAALRKDHVRPAEIDGSPCQLLQIFSAH